MARRVRTYWLVRERYRRVANIVTIVGGLAGLALVAVPDGHEAQSSASLRSVAAAAFVVLVMAAAPRLVVRGLWLLRRSRLRERLG